jgi:uncharacterized protein involved in exopolysaccharide biosynthesis
MQLGRYMRELWTHKLGLALTTIFAILAAMLLLYKVSLAPPSLESRSLGLSAASTQVVVDTPESLLTNLRQSTYSLESQTNRALLLGDVMASTPVREHIADRAGIEFSQLAVAGPVTPEEPRVIADPGQQPKTTDILKSPEEYRVSITANPTVPILDISAEAPTPAAAAKLANASVGGLRDYVEDVSREAGTPAKADVYIRQLGHATGSTVNSGTKPEFAFVAFFLVFLIGSSITIYVGRVRRGWKSGEPPRRPAPAGSEWAR